MSTYEDTLDYLHRKLPMFHRKGDVAIKKGLGNITTLCAALGQPQEQFASIHIAGTNGKGTVCHLLAAAFQSCGYKTGLYTSPHLIDFRERFRINGRVIDKAVVVDFVERHKDLIESCQPSYFELTVALAFSFFAAEKVDIAIIETGLGGRLDSTNIIQPEISVITQIGFDHTDVLGNTLEAISTEKAGIIKEQTPVVIGGTQPETKAVFLRTAKAKNAPIYFADSLYNISLEGSDDKYQYFKTTRRYSEEIVLFKTDLKGSYQKDNLRTAITALGVLREKKWILPPEKVWNGFSQVKSLTGLHGRWEIVATQPKIILEVAHNSDGIAYVSKNLTQEPDFVENRLKVVMGFVKDKDISGILTLLPKNARYYFTQANVPRALPVEDLRQKAKTENLQGSCFSNVSEAVEKAMDESDERAIILITGSFFIVGEALYYLREKGLAKD